MTHLRILVRATRLGKNKIILSIKQLGAKKGKQIVLLLSRKPLAFACSCNKTFTISPRKAGD
jgi:hypothetical protein